MEVSMENKNDQPGQNELELLDAPLAAPRHHRVIFEDERVRVMDFRVGPGEQVPVHTHRWPSVNYVLRLSHFLSYDAVGNLKVDSRTGATGIREGEAFCLPAFPPPHSVKNIGPDEMHGISFEIKD